MSATRERTSRSPQSAHRPDEPVTGSSARPGGRHVPRHSTRRAAAAPGPRTLKPVRPVSGDLVAALAIGFVLVVLASYALSGLLRPEPAPAVMRQATQPVTLMDAPANDPEPARRSSGRSRLSASDRERRTARLARRTRSAPSTLRAGLPPYGALENERGWVQSGPGATLAPNSTEAVVDAFARASCVGYSRCDDGRRIAVNTKEKRDDAINGLVDDRVLELLLELSAGHELVVMSFRSSHSPYVQDGSGRRIYSNHGFGRAVDIQAVDGSQCVTETAGKPYTDGFSNPPPSAPGPCLRLAREINSSGKALRPTETIFYFDAGGPSGVSLENHADHVHVGYNAF